MPPWLGCPLTGNQARYHKALFLLFNKGYTLITLVEEQ